MKVRVLDVKSREKQLVVKGNRLVEASYRLSTQEQRIILLMVSMIKPEDDDFHTYRIDIKHFLKLVGVTDKDAYSRAKQITQKLRERTLIIKKPGSELQVGWLSSSEYFDGKGYIELEFSPKLKPYLLRLKEVFTKYQLRNVIRLKSCYAIRVYELLKQYENAKERTFPLDELKAVLGIKPEEYKLYGDFKRKVILKSQEELREKTDLSFNFKEIKDGRKVSSLHFVIKKNHKNVELEEEDEYGIIKSLPVSQKGSNELYQRLQSHFCLSPKQAEKVLENYDQEYIHSNLEYVEEQHKKGGVKNIGSYTLKALQEDYRNKESRFDVEKKEQEASERAEKQKKELNEKLQLDYDDYVRHETLKIKSTLPDNEIKKIKQAAVETTEERFGKNNPGFKTLVNFKIDELIREQYENTIASFEEWKK